jgi:predicted AAA+ superfamily ATPase
VTSLHSERLRSLRDLCVPRKSVFDRSRRDVVLDLSDLIDKKIDANAFFEENFRTDGMARLMREAIRRLDGDSDQGVFVLSQAMGGGKTHNLNYAQERRVRR